MEMKYLHGWDVDIEEARRIQEELFWEHTSEAGPRVMSPVRSWALYTKEGWR
ncbi:MAG: hypothetical protein ABIL68_04775 [bacterium]